ncbi:hypothetical protein J6590_001984 [Homalodisca vitripennis]|nr:hypothetical protein J6590_001984 [Homalodisca vitripennis]
MALSDKRCLTEANYDDKSRLKQMTPTKPIQVKNKIEIIDVSFRTGQTAVCYLGGSMVTGLSCIMFRYFGARSQQDSVSLSSRSGIILSYDITVVFDSSAVRGQRHESQSSGSEGYRPDKQKVTINLAQDGHSVATLLSLNVTLKVAATVCALIHNHSPSHEGAASRGKEPVTTVKGIVVRWNFDERPKASRDSKNSTACDATRFHRSAVPASPPPCAKQFQSLSSEVSRWNFLSKEKTSGVLLVINSNLNCHIWEVIKYTKLHDALRREDNNKEGFPGKSNRKLEYTGLINTERVKTSTNALNIDDKQETHGIQREPRARGNEIGGDVVMAENRGLARLDKFTVVLYVMSRLGLNSENNKVKPTVTARQGAVHLLGGD